MLPTTVSKPIATVTIEPTGRRSAVPRDHLIKVAINLSPIDPKYADRGHVGDVVRKALGGFSPADGERDRRAFGDVSVSRHGKAGAVRNDVVGVEGWVVWPGGPTDLSVEELRTILRDEGYRVATRRRRECEEPTCTTDVMVDWGTPESVPSGWYSNAICGRHNYRTCASCASIYVLASTNSVGQAPSVHCEVCGAVLVEWGSSKVWIAELVQRGQATHS
jgi:hypothetical protein